MFFLNMIENSFSKFDYLYLFKKYVR